MTDKEKLTWLHDRLVNVHGENKNVDYMQGFKRIIDAMPEVERDEYIIKTNLPSGIKELHIAGDRATYISSY